MGVCWFCYWGWATPIAKIFDEARSKVGVAALRYGRSHIVWADENFDDDSINFCLNLPESEINPEFVDYDNVIIESLKQLLLVPQHMRLEPADYDDENPENYPPTFETVHL